MEKIIAENARLQTLVADKELEIKELRINTQYKKTL